MLLFLTKLDAKINIPDANFKAKLLEADTNNTIARDLDNNYVKIDVNNDGEIQETEAANISALLISSSGNSPIYSLVGIRNFNNLKLLACEFNNYMTSLDLQELANLQFLYCSGGKLTSLNLQGCVNLEYLDCHNNQLASLNLQGFSKLKYLDCTYNQLISLNLSSCTSLNNLYCNNNQLISLDLQGCSNLQGLFCFNNQLTSLDVQDCNNIKYLYCYINRLTSLYMKNGHLDYESEFGNNPDLKFICCDESEMSRIQDLLNFFEYNNVTVSSDCSLLQSSEVINKQRISVYPNPTKDIAFLETPEKIKKIEIFDISGRLIKTELKVVNNKISVSNLPKGNYILKIYIQSFVFNSKLIKE